MLDATRGAADTGRAMSRQNVELVRAGFEAFARGDIESVLRLCDEDILVTHPFEIPDVACQGAVWVVTQAPARLLRSSAASASSRLPMPCSRRPGVSWPSTKAPCSVKTSRVPARSGLNCTVATETQIRVSSKRCRR
jgi:hypothetical protein